MAQLSQYVIDSLNDNVNQLGALRKDIQAKMKADTRYAFDDGVRALYAFVGEMSTTRFAHLSQPMSTSEADLLENEVWPHLAGFLFDMRCLWRQVQQIVDGGGDGEAVTDTYDDTDPATNAYKLDAALDTYYGLHPSLGFAVSIEAMRYMTL